MVAAYQNLALDLDKEICSKKLISSAYYLSKAERDAARHGSLHVYLTQLQCIEEEQHRSIEEEEDKDKLDNAAQPFEEAIKNEQTFPPVLSAENALSDQNAAESDQNLKSQEIQYM